MTDTEKMLAEANGVQEDIYPSMVEAEIRKKYQIPGAEIAIIRKAVKRLFELTKKTPGEEFMKYYNEVEGIKAALKAELQIGEEEAQE